VKRLGWPVLLLGFAAAAFAAPPAEEYASGKTNFRITCETGEQVITLEYQIQTLMALGGDQLDFRSETPGLTLETEAGQAEETAGGWRWHMPRKPGIYSGTFAASATGETMRVHVAVLVPAEHMRNGRLNSYRLGRYPAQRRHARDLDSPPRGFVEVTEANQETWLSPHFQLKQFVCKQRGSFPKYICLDARLLVKLEVLLGRLHARYGARRLEIMSGYRTPYYNRNLGDAEHSSHLWGRAADVFVDNDRDGVMDDLNCDGRQDWRDAQCFYEVADDLDASGLENVAIGGLGVYNRNRCHGPFVHVDTRGYRARWGLLPATKIAGNRLSE